MNNTEKEIKDFVDGLLDEPAKAPKGRKKKRKAEETIAPIDSAEIVIFGEPKPTSIEDYGFIDNVDQYTILENEDDFYYTLDNFREWILVMHPNWIFETRFDALLVNNWSWPGRTLADRVLNDFDFRFTSIGRKSKALIKIIPEALDYEHNAPFLIKKSLLIEMGWTPEYPLRSFYAHWAKLQTSK